MATNSPKGGDPRNHHYVPQCYLKGFSRNRSKNSQIYVVDTKERRAFMSTPRNVGASRDFNRIVVEGLDPNEVEAGYGEFESKLAPALVRLDEARQFANEDDRDLVLELISLMAVRNPDFREARRQALERSAKIMGSVLVANRERYEGQMQRAREAGYVKGEASFEEMRNFIDEERYTVEVPTTNHVATELKLLDSMREMIHGRKWTLLAAPVGSGGFITSDHPVVLEWDDPKMKGGFYAPGFGMKKTSVICPLTKHLTLHGHFETPGGGPVELDVNGVAEANTRQIWQSQRQIYSESDNFLFLGKGGVLQRGSELLSDRRASK
ncbi:DUF4238 domain-containing protein [Cupriavidus necator]|uniref:DUF4238 domain-containing protein n=1 Tax=Cupriavidus necator TaxID=106590 RepID=UPI003ED035BA